MALTKVNANAIKAGAITADKIASGAITADKVANGVSLGSAAPTIATITITDSNFNDLDDTAVDIAGGYIKIAGSEFQSGCAVMVGLVSATAVTVTSNTELRVQVPAQDAGTYPIYVINPDGITAAKLVGLTYSGVPTWVTSSSLPDSLTGASYEITLDATDAISYTVANGSSLPTGLTLNSNTGVISGNVTVESATSYTFTILATDAELQDSPRTFNLNVTVNPPFTELLVVGDSAGANTGTFTVDSVNSIVVYGCGGGGNGGYGTGTWLGGYAYGGGGGAASQLTGYTIAVTPGETLAYSVGGPGQATTITRNGTTIFELNPGASAGNSQSGAGGGSGNMYSSHAGGSGGGGGSRNGGGSAGQSVTGCAGGGGGGGYGDNSPVTYGQPGGGGGTSSVTGSVFSGTTGGSGGGVGSSGANILLAYGGKPNSADVWAGGGGGAGGGIRLTSAGGSTYYGGGAGGDGGNGTLTPSKGGPGLLYVVAGS